MKCKPLVCLFLPIVMLGACGKNPAGEVVVYTSFDSIFAQEVFDTFTRQTGEDVLVAARRDLKHALMVSMARGGSGS